MGTLVRRSSDVKMGVSLVLSVVSCDTSQWVSHRAASGLDVELHVRAAQE